MRHYPRHARSHASGGPELDLNASFAAARTADETDYDGEANQAAFQVLRELVAEYGLSHREAALLIFDTWSGPPDTLPGDYRGRGEKYPIILNLHNELWEIISPRSYSIRNFIITESHTILDPTR